MKKNTKANLEKLTELIYSQMCLYAGEYINHVRKKEGISLRELYRQTNISIAVLSDLENGLKMPRLETLIKLAVTLGIPLDILFEKILPKQRLYMCNDSSYRDDNSVRTSLLNEGCSKDEVKEIMNFVEFTKSKRSK